MNDRRIGFLVSLVVAMLTLTVMAAPAIAADWPQFHYDIANAGCSPSDAPDDNTLMWVSTDIGAASSSQAMIVDDKVFVYADDDVYALSKASGAVLWQTSIPGDTQGWGSWASPAYDDGMVFVSAGYHLTKLNAADGAKLQEITFPDGGYSCNGGPTVADGMVFAGSGGANYYAFDENDLNTVLWTYAVPTWGAASTPAVADGRVVVGEIPWSGASVLSCIDEATGTIGGPGTWTTPLVGDVGGSAAIDAVNNRVYVATFVDDMGDLGKLYALAFDSGAIQWSADITYTDSTPAISGDYVYVSGSVNAPGVTYCFDQAGTLQWSVPCGSWTQSPAIADGKLFMGKVGTGGWAEDPPGSGNWVFTGYDGICVFDAMTGAPVWSYEDAGSSPSVAESIGMAVSVGNDGMVYAFGKYPNNVYLVEQDSSAAYSETTTVEVYADTTDDFQGGQFYLEYPDGCANITDVDIDVMWDTVATADLTTYPHAVFVSFMKDLPIVNGVQHICTLTIRCDNTDYCVGDLDFKLEGEVLAGKGSKLKDDMGSTLSDVGWQDGTFTCMNLPDLVITEVYGVQQTGDDYTVNYTIENQGNALAASGHSTALYIDGTWIEDKAVPDVLAVGASATYTFNTTLTMIPDNDLMNVCADTNDDVMELDETNNCMESFYPAGIEIKVVAPEECVDFQEQFTVDIDVDPRNIPTYGVQYTLSFDNGVLHAEWQNEGTFLNHDGASTNVYINTIDNGAGTISFAATRIGDVGGVTDPGTLATIKFTAIQQGGFTDLNLSDVIAANDNGGEILPVDLIDDTVCVNSNIPPVAIGKTLHIYNNDGQKYICKVYFDGTASDDEDGSIVYWRWAFGDGNYGTGDLKDHVYQSWNWNGTGYDPFNASLTVTDDGDPHQLDDTMFFDVIVYTAGDANGDGRVNILDATIVGLEWGESTDCSGAYCWEGNDRGSQADLNNDCNVNILDAVIVGTCWGHTAW